MKMKGKKGMEAINVIVLVVIALVVLIVVLFIFKDQIGRALKGFTGISEEAQETAKGEKCRTLLGDRDCNKPTVADGRTINCPGGSRKVSTPIGKNWTDCSSEEVCCEQVY